MSQCFRSHFHSASPAHLDWHLRLLPAEREREANYSTKLGIKLPSCPYEETVPLEQGLGLIRRVMERKGCFLRAGVPHPFWIKRTEMYRAFNAAPLAITKKALEVP